MEGMEDVVVNGGWDGGEGLIESGEGLKGEGEGGKNCVCKGKWEV